MEYNEMQRLKREMFSRRNGIIVDALRKGGSKFKIIFGLNLPQLKEVADMFPQNKEFAIQVWNNSSTRESMLIAPMLMPGDDYSKEEAIRWITEAPEKEVVDVLCLKLLRTRPYALDLVNDLLKREDKQSKYAGLRLLCNLAPQHPETAVKIGEQVSEPEFLSLKQILLSYR